MHQIFLGALDQETVSYVKFSRNFKKEPVFGINFKK